MPLIRHTTNLNLENATYWQYTFPGIFVIVLSQSREIKNIHLYDIHCTHVLINIMLKNGKIPDLLIVVFYRSCIKCAMCFHVKRDSIYILYTTIALSLPVTKGHR